jgi:hypothetical protein
MRVANVPLRLGVKGLRRSVFVGTAFMAVFSE